MKSMCVASIAFLFALILHGQVLGATLHAILVSTSALPSSGAGNISQGTDAGLALMDRILRSVAEQTGLNYSSELVQGASFDAAHVNSAVDDLDVESDDAIVFWYGGHGYHNPGMTDRFPSMFVPAKSSPNGYGGIQLVQIRERILTKKPRLTLIVFDSCNSLISGYPDNPLFATYPGIPRSQTTTQALQRLFTARGVISIAGASVGTEGWVGDRGGMFTLQLLNVFTSAVGKGTDDWRRIVAAATARIDDGYGHAQQPVFEVNLQ